MWLSWLVVDVDEATLFDANSFDNDFDGDTTMSYRPTRASLTNRLSLALFNTLPVTTPINKFVRFIGKPLSRDFSRGGREKYDYSMKITRMIIKYNFAIFN